MISKGLTIKVNSNGLSLSQCRYGTMFYSGPYIGKCFELYGEYSESEVEIFKAYIKEGDVVIDVGANIGDLTLPLSHLVGASGRVFAFESNPDTFNILCANLMLNAMSNTRPVNAFVAENSRVDTSSLVWGQHAYTGEIWKPVFTTIDELQLEKLNFLKIDVDGSELTVLKSGVETIKKYRPVLYFENDIKEASQPVMTFVLELGYRIFFHAAPIFQPDNYYTNPVNAWAPNSICSLMMLAVPPGIAAPSNLREVQANDDWWHEIN